MVILYTHTNNDRFMMTAAFFLLLLTMHLNKFISSLYMFRVPCAHHQEVKIVL